MGVAIGVRNAAAAATAVLMSTGRGDIPMLAAAATPIGNDYERGGRVADELPHHRGEHEQARKQRYRTGAANEIHKLLGHQLRRAGFDHRGGKRHHGADEDHRRPADGTIRLLDGHDARQDDGAGRQQAGNRGGTIPVASRTTMRDKNCDRLARPRPHRHSLTPDQLRRTDDQNVRIVEVDVERLPGSLQKHRIAGLQTRSSRVLAALVAGIDLGSCALHRKHDQVTAFA